LRSKNIDNTAFTLFAAAHAAEVAPIIGSCPSLASARVLVERCLIPGGFFSEEALDKVVRHAVARFEGKGLLPE